jgi:hypothetical protein
MSDLQPRWLSPEQAAAYIGERVDRLPRLVRSGKMPKPSLHLGPRTPRYDRLALDELFGAAAASTSLSAATERAVNAIVERARARREEKAGKKRP